MSTPPPTPPTAALTESLVALAEGLVPREGVCHWPSVQPALSDAARTHGRWPEVVDHLQQEPGVAPLLRRGGFQSTTGVGFDGLSAPDLLDALLLATWQRMDISGQRGSHRRIGYTVRAILTDLCALSTGCAVDLPARILWDGPELAPDRCLHGAFGSLRWEEYVPPPYVEASAYQGLMLYTKLPVQIMDWRKADRIRAFYGSSNVTQRAVDRIVTQVQLALLEDGVPEPEDSPYMTTSGPPARVALVDIATPWNGGHFMLEGIDLFGARERIANPRALEQRLNFYVDNWRPEVDVAARRLASSADQQRREDDALVDAVTAWESLLGSNQEISFRVTASMARLLRPSVVEREELHTDLKRIYGLRSKIVHGAKDLTIDGDDDLHDQRLRATAVGAQTLRTLLGERRDLLDRPAELRSTRLLLE